MASHREALLYAVTKDDPEEFLKVIQDHNSCSSEVDLTEILPSLSQQQLNDVWKKLHQWTMQQLLPFLTVQVDDGQQEAQSCCKKQSQPCQVIFGVVTMALLHLKEISEDEAVPEFLLQTAVILHSILPNVPEEKDKLKNQIAQLCELWWREKKEEESLSTNTVMYLLQRTLREKGTKVDVKRVWALKDCLLEFRLQDPSSRDLQDLLLQAVQCPIYLRTQEGIKFLGFLFSLSLSFIEHLHKAIKNKLPSCNKSLAAAYGEVYFRAWIVSEGIFTQKLEEDCIQDFMFHCLHATRSGSGAGRLSLGQLLFHLLNHFHRQKKHKPTSTMLLKLYEPILWRSLKVANGYVRTNASAVLFDVFPLEDPSSTLDTNALLLEKQYEVMANLLQDPCHYVRIVSAQGVCEVMTVYWQILPSEIIKKFMSILVNGMVFDASCAEVRVRVIRGVTLMLGNPRTHVFLKEVLPNLKDCFHDTNDTVRASFVDLLLKIKDIKIIKFWQIVPPEHLLARLEIDKTFICRRIVSLLFNSFHPTSKSDRTILERCIHFIEENRGASRKFYQYSDKCLDLYHTVKFMLSILRALSCYVKSRVGENNDSGVLQPHCGFPRGRSNGQRARRHVDEKEDDDEEKENINDLDTVDCTMEAEDSEGDMKLNSPQLIIGLLDIVSILWTVRAKQLAEPHNKKLSLILHMKYSKAVPVFFSYFKDTEVCRSLLYLTSFLPHASVPTMAGYCLSRLRALEPPAEVEDYSVFIDALCNWKRGDDLSELLYGWLKAGLKTNNQVSVMKDRQNCRRVKFVEQHRPQPRLALELLRYILCHPVNKKIMLEKNQSHLLEIWELLQRTMTIIQEIFESSSLRSLCSDDFIQEAIFAYAKLTVILHNKEGSVCFDSVEHFKMLLAWTRRVVLNYLSRDPQTSNLDSSKRLRSKTISDSGRHQLNDLCHHIMEKILMVAMNVIILGTADRALIVDIADIFQKILESDRGSKYLSLGVKISYHICDYAVAYFGRDHQFMEKVVPDLMGRILGMLTLQVKDSSDPVSEVLTEVKPLFVDILGKYQEAFKPSDNCFRDMISTFLACVLQVLGQEVNKQRVMDPVEKVSELPVLASEVLWVLCSKQLFRNSMLSELTELLRLGEIQGFPGLLAILSLLYIFSHNPGNLQHDDIKSCVDVADGIFLKIIKPDPEHPQTEQEESSEGSEDVQLDRSYFVSSRNLITAIKEQLGITS